MSGSSPRSDNALCWMGIPSSLRQLVCHLRFWMKSTCGNIFWIGLILVLSRTSASLLRQSMINWAIFHIHFCCTKVIIWWWRYELSMIYFSFVGNCLFYHLTLKLWDSTTTLLVKLSQLIVELKSFEWEAKGQILNKIPVGDHWCSFC